MARYQALELSFVNNSLVQEGAIVDLDEEVMVPGPNFAKVDEEDEPVASKPARKGKAAAGEDKAGADLA